MTDILTIHHDEYFNALCEYIEDEGETSLARAYEIGHKAIENGLGIMNIIETHQAVVLCIPGSHPDTSETTRRAGNFLVECLAPFEMVHRGFREANDALRKMNNELEAMITERTEDLANVNLALQAQIEEYRKVVEALSESEERFRLLVDRVRDYAIFMVDIEGNVTSWNEGAERTNGWSADEIIGKHFSIFYTDEDIRAGHPGHRLESARNKGSHEEEGWRVRRGGSLFFASSVINAILDSAGNLRGFAMITRDITERRKIEEELARSNRELEVFAYAASHDLQEPLRKITIFADRLQMQCGSQLDEQGVDYLKRMQKSVLRMRALINGILAYSRISTNRSPFERVDLTAVLKAALSDLELRISEMRARIEVEDLPEIMGNPLQMSQLFQNIISNSLKFVKANEAPVISIKSRTLTDTTVEIIFQDNGIGFAEEYLETVFKPFHRLNPKSEYEGTGLGLAICQKIVSYHGGVITAESSPANGAKFIVRLPVLQKAGNCPPGIL